jgi:glycosyltransferase involved in cell wall biosynthesis
MNPETVNLHIYLSPFKNESRILKETASIIRLELADEIIIVASWRSSLPLKERIDEKRKVVRFKSFFQLLPNNIISESLRFFHLIFLIFFRFRSSKPAFVNCHSLSVLFAGVLFKKFANSVLIYDAHELETERAGLKGIKKFFAKGLEKILIHQCDHVIVVSNSIADWYKQEYNLNEVHVVRNVPDTRTIKPEKNSILKDKFKISSTELLFIYQGLLSKGRGVEIILNSFSKTSPDKHLVLMGYGTLESEIKSYESKFPNIHFQPAVSPHEIMSYTKGCDVGICLIENIGLSYYYCLPNKFFEYILSGVPVIASNFPDMSVLINQYTCGWLIEPEEKYLTGLINQMNTKNILAKKENCLRIDSLGWQKEELLFSKIFVVK